MGDDEAVEAVEAFEVKYGRLKDRYKQLEAAAAEEAEELTAQLLEAQDALRKAQQQAASTGPGAAAAGAHSNGAAAAGVSTKEFEALRNENEQLVSQLVAKQMELAELAEQQVRRGPRFAGSMGMAIGICMLVRRRNGVEARAWGASPKGLDARKLGTEVLMYSLRYSISPLPCLASCACAPCLPACTACRHRGWSFHDQLFLSTPGRAAHGVHMTPT